VTALHVLCAQLTRDLFAIAQFLVIHCLTSIRFGDSRGLQIWAQIPGYGDHLWGAERGTIEFLG